MTDFVSLHNQTSYSLLDSLIEPKALFKRAKELGQSAIAITDHGSIGAAWDAWKASKDTGVKLIIGCESYFQDDATNINEKFRHLILLAKNAVGYRNLLTLNKKGFDQNSFIGKRVYSVIDWKLLAEHTEGLICLTACGNGIISQLLMNHKIDEAEKTLLKLRDLFGDNLGIEVQPNNMKRGSNIFNDEIDQFFLNRQLINLGKKHNIRVVAACNTHYLTKEESETHDVFLAIGSHQPIYSNFRLRYPVPDFYLKTGDEVKAFFTRNYGEEIAQQLCDNSIYFANLCEKPEWIDPKFSNPTGKELPVFPVKQEPDYTEFCKWIIEQSPEIQKLDEDKLFLRYRCEKVLLSRVKDINDQNRLTYQNRLAEELDVIESNGFSSYMLIVADFIQWARDNGIAVGEGRGCLTGDTQVLTEHGFKRLDCIVVDDRVFSHRGELKSITETFKFDMGKESLLDIKSFFSYESIKLTKDHKLLIASPNKKKVAYEYVYNGKAKRVQRYVLDGVSDLHWIEANSIKKGDYLFTPFLNRLIQDPLDIKLSDFGDCQIENGKIKVVAYKSSVLSIKNIHKKSGLSFERLRHFKKTGNYSQFGHENANCLSTYLSEIGLTVDDFLNEKNFDVRLLNEYIPFDSDFAYLLGRWMGDGSLHHENGISIDFDSKDIVGINRIKLYLSGLGFHVCHENRESNVLLTITNKNVYRLFKQLFPDYQNSYSKQFPIGFRSLPPQLLISIIKGLSSSDGCVESIKTDKVKTTSLRMMKELREVLMYLTMPSSVYTEIEPKRYGKSTATAYTIRFPSLSSGQISKNIIVSKNGYFCRVKSLVECKSRYVYDITVKDDHSYLTSNGIVHNSVGGSLIAYILNIHQADPIKYDLIFARFLNKEKKSLPDIDTDFAPSGREKVQNYLRQKYGEDNVAHVSNVNTITPKVYARDIARACELGGSKEAAVKIGNEVADCLPAEIHSIDDALAKVPLFAEYAKKYPAFEKYKNICGKYRAWSTHAGGIIISARPLTGLVPLRRDKDGALAIEYDKDKAEENGLVKMDTLGLSTLDIIGQTMQLIKAAGKEVPKVINYDDYDKETYDIISSGDTFCVFQLGTSGGTIDLCRRIKPQSVNDISYINSLARPSARDMRNDFILTKDGKKPFSLLHPNLGRAFNNTFGFGLYEESLMYLAQDVAGWSLHSADRLRKLTKEKGKNPKKAQEWRAEFIKDAIHNNVNESIAKRIWDEVVDKFQGYGFNMSLSVLETVDIYSCDGKTTTKNLEEVSIGDRLRSRDEQSGLDILVEVINKHDHGVLELFEIELTTGEKVKCTMDHKFRVEENGEMLPLWWIIKEGLTITVNTVNINVDQEKQ